MAMLRSRAMADILRYDKLVERALRSVVREALSDTAKHGLRGGHHFFLTFETEHPGVQIPAHLREKYPERMTIVLEHQFWDLEVDEECFAVTLSFANTPARLTIPFAALTAFADPSAKFGLQFEAVEGEPGTKTTPAPARTTKPPAKRPSPKLVEAPAEGTQEKKPGEVVTLDAF